MPTGVFQPSTTTASLYTTIKHGVAASRYYGFLPPHGRTLGSNEEMTFFGSVNNWFERYGHGMSRRSFEQAVDAEKVLVKNGPAVVLYNGTVPKVLTLSNTTLGSADPSYKAATIVSATVSTNGLSLTLVFSKVVTMAAATGWTLTATGTPGTATSLTYSSGSGSTTVVFTIGRAVHDSGEETLALAYTGLAGYTDADGNVLPAYSLNNASITNNSTV